MKKQISSIIAPLTIFFIMFDCFSFITIFATSDTGDGFEVPIKWGIVIVGGYNYYRDLTYNAIQRIEKIIQGRGVPYDLFCDDDIEAPRDKPSEGKYPLQFKNGSIRYQALVLLFDYEQSDSAGVNQEYIYWAIANGTNVLLFNKVAMYVPKLLNMTAGEMRWLWAQTITNLLVLKPFNDGIKEYKAGSNISIGLTLQWHTIIHNYEGMTIWLNKTWDTGWTIGMANTTYGRGKVWYLGWSWNDAFRLEDPLVKYVYTWSTYNFDIWGHAINFAFQNVEQISVTVMPYKRWKGAWVIRFDTDHYIWEDYWLPPESILKAGWTWDYHFCVLGYGRPGGVQDLVLYEGVPEGYQGIPSVNVMYTNITGVLCKNGMLKNYVAIIYNSSVNGNYDRIKIDFNEDRNFENDTPYELWEYIQYPDIVGKLYWCSITPNLSCPNKINIAWHQTPMLFKNETVKEKFKEYGHKYSLSYSFHGWQHTEIPYGNSTCTFAMWNGTAFMLNATYINKKFDEAKYWMGYSFSQTGSGFEADEVIISYPGDNHPDVVHSIVGNLSWFLFENVGTTHGYFVGFAKQNPSYKYWLSSSRTEYWYDESNFTIIQEMVQTLYPVISTYGHMLNDDIFDACYNYSFPPYSNSVKPANPREAFHFWQNLKYTLEHITSAFYKNGKIILEYKANNTFIDYVWKFPLEYDGKFFNNFADNKTLGKLKYIDGKYVYVEFNEGENERIEVSYGNVPHIYQVSGYIENISQKYTPKRLQLRLWNNSGTINVIINCSRLQKPSLIIANGNSVNFDYNVTTKLCYFNISFNGLRIIDVIWERVPPDPPRILSPTYLMRFDPSESVTFSWEFNDPDVSDFQYAYRFQLANDPKFTSVIIDTGKVITSQKQIVQKVPSVVSLYYWRVKTWDNQDAEGDWSSTSTIIVDRLLVVYKGTTANRTNIGNNVLVYFKIIREFDNMPFDGAKGTVYINNIQAIWDEVDGYWKIIEAQNSIGEWNYKVSNIIDSEYNIKTIVDIAGEQKIIWDQLIVAITADKNTATVGTLIRFEVKAIYAYDNKPVSRLTARILRNGTYFATNNFTDTSSIPCTYQYTIESIKDENYGLTKFSLNPTIATWTPKSITRLLAEWLASNILIIIAFVQLIVAIIFIIMKSGKKNQNNVKT